MIAIYAKSNKITITVTPLLANVTDTREMPVNTNQNKSNFGFLNFMPTNSIRLIGNAYPQYTKPVI